MSTEKCVIKDCGAIPDDEPKRTLFNFPIDDKERSQRWVDACENDEILKQYKEGVLGKNIGVCGFHFPVAFRASKDLPMDIDPVPSSKCTCQDSTHTQCVTGAKARYINSEHSYNKKTVKVNNETQCSIHGKNGNNTEKLVVKQGQKSYVNKRLVAEPAFADDHLYFVNTSSDPSTEDNDTWSRSAVIHQKEPEKVKRKRNFHVFTDTTTSRWTCIPHTSRFQYMSKVIKFHNLEADAKVMDLTKTVNKVVDITFRDNVEEEETEYWDLHSSDARPNVNVAIKSSWLPNHRRNQPIVDFRKKLEKEKTLSKTLGLEVYKEPSYQLNQSQSGNSLLKPNYVARINAPPNNCKQFFGSSMTKVKEVNGIPVRITGPFKNNHSVFSKQTLNALGLTPQSQYVGFDFTSSDMSYWHYQCDNGILETVVECKSKTDKSQIVKLPAKTLISQLILTNKKMQFLRSNHEKRKVKNQMKCRDHIKEIRRLRYKIAQMQKEMDAPKAYEKFLNEDQIEAMDKESLHGHHWKDDTIVLGHNIRLACTTKGYKYLAKKLHWPLPSVKTLVKRAKDLHLPFPEAVRTVLVRKPGEGKRRVAQPKSTTINGLTSESVDDEDYNDGSKPNSSSVISINPSSKVNSPKLVKIKRKRRTKEEIMRDKLNKGLTVNVGEISNLIYNNQVDFNGQQQVIVQKPKVTEPKTVKKPRKKKVQEIPVVEDQIIIKKVKTIDHTEIIDENICFEETIPEFLDENEVYYKFVKLENDQLEEVINGQPDFIYSDQLQTLADASFIHQSPQKLTDKKIIVRSVNADSPDKNSNQFHKYFAYNISAFDGFSNT